MLVAGIDARKNVARDSFVLFIPLKNIRGIKEHKWKTDALFYIIYAQPGLECLTFLQQNLDFDR